MNDKMKIAIALRTARTILGMSQQELAAMLEVSKVTIARNETNEMTMRADTLTKMISGFRSLGVDIDMFSDPEQIIFKVNDKAIAAAEDRLADANRRRSDRKVKSS